MNNNKQKTSKWILVLFIAQVLINWMYVIWIQRHAYNISNGWFTLLPLLGFFYVVIAILTINELFHRTKLGLSFAFCIILFGVISDAISYSFIPNKSNLFELILILLVVMNGLVTFFMAYNKSYFNSD